MNQAIQFKDNVGLVHFQAKRGFKWASGSGLNLSYDDMFQEASLAFVVAANGFKPEAGYKFSAYYTMVAFSEFRKSIGIMTGVKNLNKGQRAEIDARSEENSRLSLLGLPQLPNVNYGLAPVNMSSLGTLDGAEGEGESFEAGIASNARTPEDIYEAKQAWEAATVNLSPLAGLIAEWLRDPPPEMLKEFACQRAYAEECTAAGVRASSDDGVSLKAVTKFMRLVGDIPERQMLLAQAELLDAVKQIERA